MKGKNRPKYTGTESRLHELGYNNNDIFETRVVSDQNCFKIEYKIKSKIAEHEADKLNLFFIRSITRKKTKIAGGCWIGNQADYLELKRVVLPFVLSLIEQNRLTDIYPSGDNQ